MAPGLLVKLFGSRQERNVKKLLPDVHKVNALEKKTAKLSDKALAAITDDLRGRLTAGETLDDILPEAFACVREAAKRTVGLRHHDVQLIGGIVLHQGSIAEMANGEGKTLVATLAAYLNAIEGKGVHIVTVNDYLARRDREWMGPVYEFLGLTVGVIQQGMSSAERRQAYRCDVVYGTNNQFGFDYLRDNMVIDPENQVQRGFHYAIVDEIDSILVDEARTPLIISGASGDSTELYYTVDKLVRRLNKGPEQDYEVDEKDQTIALTEKGVEKAQRLLRIDNLYEPGNWELVHHINQAIRAHELYERDRDYLVKDGQVMIIDEFTGRLMEGRRWGDGLHQAVEAKEGVTIRSENQTLATITLQNFFRMYRKLSGMTGTAATEEEEFKKIYDLDVVTIPTNVPCRREEEPDRIYQTAEAKFDAVLGQIDELYRQERPVLVGTRSVEQSEQLSRLLKQRGIPHTVLNAKYHEREAQIVSQAGQKRAVTIATNMAGRGTDIKLGEGVLELGGLYVIGTERHESRRIDNQLRGRAGRQGAPGAAQFYVSLQDELMRIFGSERIAGVMNRLHMPPDQPIEHSWISKALERAQQKVERRNFDIRKQLLEYDDVMNQQRHVVYTERSKILQRKNLKEETWDMVVSSMEGAIVSFVDGKARPEEWDRQGLAERLYNQFGLAIDPQAIEGAQSTEAIAEVVLEEAQRLYEQREEELGEELMRNLERMLFLRTLDAAWKEHLHNMDILKQGIGLRGYGQRDPLIEYKREAYAAFENMIEGVKEQVAELLFKVRVTREPSLKRAAPRPKVLGAVGPSSTPQAGQGVATQATVKKKVGRNDPCPCGSGKKYKHCCGR